MKKMMNTELQMTQLDIVSDYLRQGKSLTQLEALQKFGIMRLAPIIHLLRKDGYNIKTKLVGKQRYATYQIEAANDNSPQKPVQLELPF